MTQIERIRHENRSLKIELIRLRHTVQELTNPTLNSKDKIYNAYRIICKMFYGDIALKTRKQDMVKGRQFWYNYVRYNSTLSLTEMSNRLCQFSLSSFEFKQVQDHSTVIHALEEFDTRYRIEKSYKKQYDEFINLMSVESNNC